MIQRVSDVNQPLSAPDTGQKPAAQKILRHTPFGDVMVDELATTDVFALVRPPSSRENRAPVPTADPSASAPAPLSAAGAAGTAVTAGTALSAIPDASAMTAQALFGDHPWLEMPTGSGPGGSFWYYNPVYFATRQTADKVAALVGGKVVERNFFTPDGPLQQHVPNEMIELPNGRLVVAGLIANFFAHGYSPSFVQRLLQLETQGA
jgi:hypothetical protein